jgi:hypothetical protein
MDIKVRATMLGEEGCLLWGNPGLLPVWIDARFDAALGDVMQQTMVQSGRGMGGARDPTVYGYQLTMILAGDFGVLRKWD